MAELSNQHQAYQLIMEKYMVKPTEEELDLCSSLFEDWSKSGNQSLLSHLIEIIDNHESKKISEIAILAIKEHFPKNKRNQLIELWIIHPTPSLKEFIKQIIKSSNITKPLVSASYVMLDEWDLLEELDPDFVYLDQYLKQLDPIVSSLLFARVSQIKSFLRYEMEDDTLLDKAINVDQESLIDKIRAKDYDYLWERILQYPLPFVAELVSIFFENNWKPKNKADETIYELLLEQLGDKGWAEIEKVKWNCINIQKNNKFTPLQESEIIDRNFDLITSEELVRGPDRIIKRNFVSRGRFNLVHPDIDLHLYAESIRRSEIDGVLHIPIYTANGFELAEFTIPSLSINNFNMDVDGLYFTVRNKNGLYSVDMDVLASLLLPVNRHSEAITEVLSSMKEKASPSTKLTIDALDLLSVLHRGREFSLWDLKEETSFDLPEIEQTVCNCIIGVDLGDSETKFSYIPSEECSPDAMDWSMPSRIHYFSSTDFKIGDEIHEKLLSSTKTFSNWKIGLYGGNKEFIRIRNVIISAHTAVQDFLTKSLSRIQKELNHQVSRIAVTYPMEYSLRFQTWISQHLNNMGFSKIIFVENLASLAVGTFKLENQRGNIFIIDIGSSKISAAITELPMPKSRKRIPLSRLYEKSKSTPNIVAREIINIGSNSISKLLLSKISNSSSLSRNSQMILANNIKENLSKDFEFTFKSNNQSHFISIDKVPSEKYTDFRNSFQDSEISLAFKTLIRNVLIKSAKRGIAKDKIETVLIFGEGANWPFFLEHINDIFDNSEIIIESDKFLSAKGAASIGIGQIYEMRIERDYMLKITEDGHANFISILNRGQNVNGLANLYEIRPNARFESMVLDCWSRKPTVEYGLSNMPVLDEDRTEFRRDDDKFFKFDKVMHSLNEIKEKSHLKICVNRYGELIFQILYDSNINTINSNIFIH